MSDTTVCGFCKMHIPDDALVCAHCGAEAGQVERRRSWALRLFWAAAWTIGGFVVAALTKLDWAPIAGIAIGLIQLLIANKTVKVWRR
jgi:predicted nucleic acid-binding Zn ribbon protein